MCNNFIQIYFHWRFHFGRWRRNVNLAVGRRKFTECSGASPARTSQSKQPQHLPRALAGREIISFFFHLRHSPLAFKTLKDNLIAWVVILLGAREKKMNLRDLAPMRQVSSSPVTLTEASNMCTCVCGSVRCVWEFIDRCRRAAGRPPLWRTSSLALRH